MNIKIAVAVHKPYWLPEDPLYLPVHVGAEGKGTIDGVPARDDTGSQISGRNATFCELTALYWAWKNLDADVYGLCHYRRYFGGGAWWKPKKSRLLREKDVERLLAAHDMILPRKRRYWIETRESQYAHAHHREDLRCVEEILSGKYPEYLPAWRHMLKTRSGHICNMFIMRREHFGRYCAWLFDILFEAEKRLDISGYSEKDRRVFGYLGERLLDVWVEKNGLRFAEAPTVNLERQHWLKKGWTFLKRKYQRLPSGLPG